MRRPVLLSLLSAALVASAASAALADLARGKAAFQAGRYDEAYRQLLPDAQRGNPEAEYMIGEIAMAGTGNLRSYSLAAHWFQLAVAAGYAPAGLTLGMLYLHGAGVAGDPTAVAADPAKAAQYLKGAADAGDRNALYLLGQLYHRGQGVKQDDQTAFDYIAQAATKGVVGAQFEAGLMAMRGEGTRRDPVEAYKWFKLAADLGYPGAKTNLDLVARDLSPDQLSQARSLAARFRPQG